MRECEEAIMPRMTEEQAARRKDEILDACDALYRESAFQDITIKDIAERTSLSRPSIYNYFETIGEIFLGLLEREYSYWANDLSAIAKDDESLDLDKLASEIAYSLERRKTMLRIQAANLYEVEDTSRLERLADFKRAMRRAMDALDACLMKFLPPMDRDDCETFRLAFFPFLCGVFAYANPTEKQCRAMDNAGIPHRASSVYELSKNCLLQLLS